MRPELHPACAAFPALPEEDLAALAADIRANGLLESITLDTHGLLLDGRCRWDACEREGIEPRTIVYDGNDPIGFVASKNRHRRHLSKSQMAMGFARLVALSRGSNQFKLRQQEVSEKNGNLLSRRELLEISGVSKAYMDTARTIILNGAPNIVAMVDSGEVINLRTVADVAVKYDHAAQAAFTASDVKRIGKEIREKAPWHQKETVKPTKPKPKIVNPPYLRMEWPTREELEYPESGSSVQEYDAYFAKYGRTPLHPKAIKEMHDADSLTSGLANVVRTMTHSSHPDAEQFFAYIDHLATHRRESDKTNGAQIDFAGRGRATLTMLEAALPRALQLLNELQAKLAARRSSPAAINAEWAAFVSKHSPSAA